MDFYEFRAVPKEIRGATNTSIFFEWKTKRWQDLMVRGGKMYAFWDENKGLWNRYQDDLVAYCDQDMWGYIAKYKEDRPHEFRVVSSWPTIQLGFVEFINFCKVQNDEAGHKWVSLEEDHILQRGGLVEQTTSPRRRTTLWLRGKRLAGRAGRDSIFQGRHGQDHVVPWGYRRW